ncbi:putative B3 domain-containing protein Os03g0621600 [Abrus precatorius]|uniref:B3 domain-containing protein Os03g0621600 n=1 Tax=Abrus precatorius TaxID=3816 RepID=A0A8B8MCH6_ABRPR|nr:putative B3 domain-containing protein Os03g0621600 [Abrus precatorius]
MPSGENATLPICFFKIILKANIERLKIPNKFTRRYGGGLSNPVFIKPPDGTEWKVYWTKENGEVWLEKGWKEIVENYSLDHGYLVVFKYEGTSHIDILILDHTALEIDYPFCDTYCDENDNLNQNQTDDKSIEILDEFPDQKATHITGDKAIERTSLNWPTQTRAKEVAIKFISKNPFFTVYITPSLLGASRVTLPDLNVDIENKEKNVILKSGDRSWNLKLLRRHNPSSVRKLSAGWSLFVKESQLIPGDWLSDTASQLHILFMATQIGQRNAFLPIHFFKIIIESNVEKLKIPNSFTRTYGDGLSNPVLIKPPDGTEWEVCLTKENGEVWFDKGWKEFAENYSIGYGHLVVFKYEGSPHVDVLIFDKSALEIDHPPSENDDDEMDNHDECNDASVMILEEFPPHQKTRSNTPLFSPPLHKKMRNNTHENVEANSNSQKLQADTGDHSEPGTKCVKGTQRTTSLNMPRSVRAQEKHVPKFMDIGENERSVMMQLGERSWCVKLVRAPKSSYDRFSSGWSVFVKESKLKTGNICIFELIDRELPSLKVHVF